MNDNTFLYILLGLGAFLLLGSNKNKTVTLKNGSFYDNLGREVSPDDVDYKPNKNKADEQNRKYNYLNSGDAKWWINTI